jgi:hypothetical protein
MYRMDWGLGEKIVNEVMETDGGDETLVWP